MKMMDKLKKRSGTVEAVILILLSWSVLFFLCGENPVQVVGYIMSGSFKDMGAVASVLNKIFLFFLLAIAYAIPDQAGLANVGIDGQFIAGGFFAALLPQFVNTGNLMINVGLSVLVAMFFGSIWAFWPALLKVKYGINEVVTTLLGNYIIIELTEYMVAYPLRMKGSSISRMDFVPENFELPMLFSSKFSSSLIFVAIVLAAAVWYNKRTVKGFEARMVGKNLLFARQAGINTDVVSMRAMMVGGAIAGLAGAIQALYVNHTFQSGFTNDYGMKGMLVALVAMSNPVGCLVIAVLFGILQVGAISMQLSTDIPSEIAAVLQAIMIFFVAAKGALVIKVRRREK